MLKKINFILFTAFCCFIGNVHSSEIGISPNEDIVEIKVKASRVANNLPANTYSTVTTALRFDPLTELQPRGIAEGQSDVTVRGGLFENTGFKVGAITINDPQTGHYVAELPIDPAILTAANIHIGIDNAVEGFNSSVATVSYKFKPIDDGGDISLGLGNDNFNSQSMRIGHTIENDFGKNIGVGFSLAKSEGDGSLEFGDHQFMRANLQFQHATDNKQTDLVLSYQDKFFGWPGAYTGYSTLPEIDDTQTTLFIASHKRESTDGWFETTGFYRQLVDDYDFNRLDFEQSGAAGAFQHKTKAIGLGFQGSQKYKGIIWRYGGQLTHDELVRSTDLTNGFFKDRNYATLSLVPTIENYLQNGNKLIWRFGAKFDYSNRDINKLSPLFGLAMQRSDDSGMTVYSMEYAVTSQVPGYTALNSNPTGLFGGNAYLEREIAKQISFSIERKKLDWQLKAAFFNRRDNNLVDWTYSAGSPSARQANPVDMDVFGIEIFLMKALNSIDFVFGYTALKKDADYGSTQIDASFYALNFAKHRATAAMTYKFLKAFELRLDSEYRIQEDNPLRVGGNSTFLVSTSINWISQANKKFSTSLVIDNLTDSEYQPFPGTPAIGRQISLNTRYVW